MILRSVMLALRLLARTIRLPIFVAVATAAPAPTATFPLLAAFALRLPGLLAVLLALMLGLLLRPSGLAR